MIEAGIADYLKRDPRVSVICGNRIYPQKIPMGDDLPAITISRQGAERVGTMADIATLCKVRMEVNCWASNANGNSYQECKQLAEYVRLATGGQSGKKLDGFTGTMRGLTVRGCFVQDERDSYFPPDEADDVGVYLTQLELLVVYVEASA